MNLVELLNHNLAFENEDGRVVMTMQDLIDMAGLDEAAQVFDALMAGQNFTMTDKSGSFTYSMTDDPATLLQEEKI